MEKEKRDLSGFFAIIISICCFIASRAMNIFISSDKGMIIEAMIFTFFTFFTYFLVSKCKNSYSGILAGIVSYFMMAPKLDGLKDIDTRADIVYFIVRIFAMALFVFAIVVHYRKQSKKDITVLPILGLMLITPFCNEVGEYIGKAIYEETGTMYGYYASLFVLYMVGLVIILFIGLSSKPQGMRLVCDFEIIAILVKIGQKSVAIIINYLNENHISKSYYCWIAIYVVFVLIFSVAKEKKLKD